MTNSNGCDIDLEKGFGLKNGSTLTGSLRSKPTELTWPSKHVQCAEEELFVKNAHFLLSHAKRIFEDSKLFLTPVRIMSGMAYVGPLPMPCIGGYLEWWLNAGCASRGGAVVVSSSISSPAAH